MERLSDSKYFQQPEVTPHMRSIVVNWIAEVIQDRGFSRKILHRAVSFVDAMLSCQIITRQKLQLLGICSLLTAVIFEDSASLELNIDQCADHCDNCFTAVEVYKMKAHIEHVLQLELPQARRSLTVNGFRCVLANIIAEYSHMAAYLNKYLCDLSLESYEMLQYSPITIAASAHCLSMRLCHPTAILLIDVEENVQLSCVLELRNLYLRTRKADDNCGIWEMYDHGVTTLTMPSEESLNPEVKLCHK